MSAGGQLWVPMVEVIPPGQAGLVSVTHFEVTREDAACSWRDVPPPGRYARLTIDGDLYMTDTPFEQASCYRAISDATGDVLIAGLGLGMILIPILRKPDVRSVTVVELSADVVQLVEPHIHSYVGLDATKLKVVVGDIFTWRPPAPFDYIWLDIWPSVCTDNLLEIARLKRRYCRPKYLRPKGRITAWLERDLRRRRAAERRAAARFMRVVPTQSHP